MNNSKSFLHLEGDITVSILEWLPIGHQSIKFLQDKLECAGSERDFFITGNVDRERNASTIDVGKAEVRLRVCDFKPMESVQFVADVNIEHTGSKLQEEKIGVNVSRLGGISYGLRLKDVGDRAGYSLDEITYVVADMIEDSSHIMDTIINSYQKRILDIIYCNQSSERDKFAVITAKTLKPTMDENELLSNASYRSELRQLLGRIWEERVERLADGSIIISGENGVLMVGDHVDDYRDMLRIYGLMGCIISIQNNIFNRLSWSWDLLYEQKRRVQDEGIEEIMDIQNTISNLSADQGLLMSVPLHLHRMMEGISQYIAKSNQNDVPVHGFKVAMFMESLSIFELSKDRVDEASATLEALGRDIQNIRSLASTLGEKETFNINRAMNILTVVSVIVLPLTLITGIYGMNFWRVEPVGETVSFWNMPELYWKYGYPATLGSMLLVALGLLCIFWRKGLLLGSRKSRKIRRLPR